jgi:hypothetical protein
MTLRDDLPATPRTTELRDVELAADMPSLDSPLEYKAAAKLGRGSVSAEGAPRLFRGGRVDPAALRGTLLKLTVSDAPVDALCAHLGLEPAVRELDADLTVSADSPGTLAASGKASATTRYDGLDVGIKLDANADLKKLNLGADVTARAGEFSSAQMRLDLHDGLSRFSADATLNCDLAGLTGSAAAQKLGFPKTPDGKPAVTSGRLDARLKLDGRPDSSSVTARIDLQDFRPHPSLTGGRELPPENGRLHAEARLLLDDRRRIRELKVPSVTAKASFLDVEMTDGRVSSLDDPEKLEADLAGHARFDGGSFSSKFGKALGLPALHDRVELTFSGQGQGGRADLRADASLERIEGRPDPVRLVVSALLNAAGQKTKVEKLELTGQAGPSGSPYVLLRVEGGLPDLAAPDADVQFSGHADLAKLARRLSDYVGLFADFAPAGRVTVAKGSFAGTPRRFKTAFDLETDGVSVKGGSDRVPPALATAAEALSGEKLSCSVRGEADLPAGRLTDLVLRANSSLGRTSLDGTVHDLAGLEAELTVDADVDTARIQHPLRKLGILPTGIETKGRAELSAKLDTRAGTLSLLKLDLRLPYGTVRLAESASISGLKAAKLKADPADVLKQLAGKLRLQGTLRPGAMVALPGLRQAGLEAAGEVPFELKLSRASAASVHLTADATGAELKRPGWFDKPNGTTLEVSLDVGLSDKLDVNVRSANVALPGAELDVSGTLTDDLNVFECRRLTAETSRPGKLTAMVPALKGLRLGGSAKLSASGRVPLAGTTTQMLNAMDVNATAAVEKLRCGHSSFPDVEVLLDGRAAADRLQVNADGLDVALATGKTGHKTALAFKRLRIASAVPKAPLLKNPDALALDVSVSSGEVHLDKLLAALTKSKPGKGKTAGGGAAAAPLDLSAFARHRANLKLAVDKLTWKAHAVRNLAAELRLAENKLSTSKPATLDVYDGSAEVEMKADLGTSPISHQGSVQFTKLNIDVAASAALSLDEVVKGRAGGELTWAGKGFRAADIEKHWSGEGKVAVKDGVIMNFDKSPLLADLAGPVVKYFGGKALPQNQYRYEDMELELRLKDGRVEGKDILLEGRKDFDVTLPQVWVGLDRTYGGQAEMKVPSQWAMKHVGKLVKKVPAAAKRVTEAYEKNPPSFFTFKFRGAIGARPRVTLSVFDLPKWAIKVAGDTLRRPGNLLGDILKDAIERELGPDEDERKEREAEEKEGEDREDREDPKKRILEDALKGLFD